VVPSLKTTIKQERNRTVITGSDAEYSRICAEQRALPACAVVWIKSYLQCI